MRLPQDVQFVITAFAAKYAVPTTHDEDARAWTAKLVGQLAYAFPTAGWVHKSQSPSHPPSADTIAVWPNGWDIVVNSGSPEAALNLGAESKDLTGQHAIVIPAHDWLGMTEPPPQPPQPPPTGSCSCIDKLDAILAQMDLILEELREQRTAVVQASKGIEDAVRAGVKIRF